MNKGKSCFSESTYPHLYPQKRLLVASSSKYTAICWIFDYFRKGKNSPRGWTSGVRCRISWTFNPPQPSRARDYSIDVFARHFANWQLRELVQPLSEDC